MNKPCHSILLFSYGQSNADVLNVKPPLDHPLERDPRILAPNDGHGVRGTLGKEQGKPITGFEPAFDKADGGQSIGIAAAARLLHELEDDGSPAIIVRSGAKGGRRLDGFTHRGISHFGLISDHTGGRSPLLSSYLDTGAQIIESARNAGIPVRHVFIPFFHGESDLRLTRDAYATRLSNLIVLIDEAFVQLGVTTTWLLTQPGGTSSQGNGNRWLNRLALWSVVESFSNVHLVSANYPYPLYDTAHLDPLGKALVGEKLGLAISQLMRGIQPSLPRPTHWWLQEDGVFVEFDARDPLVLDRNQFPRPVTMDGFETTQGHNLSVLAADVVSDKKVRLTLSQKYPRAAFELQYAYTKQRLKPRPPSDGFPLGRGCLRTAKSVDSILVPGRKIYDWVPGFSIPFTRRFLRDQALRGLEPLR